MNMFAIETAPFHLTEIVLALVAVVGFILSSWYCQRDLPPGPWGLPVFGYFPFIGHKPELTFVELGKKYGNIFSIRVGQKLMVVLNDYAAIKEVFIKRGMEFMARPPGFAMAAGDHDKGLLNNKGETYLKNRRFLLSTLRDFGMGKTNLEATIHEEIQQTLDAFANSNGQPMNPRRVLSKSTVNIVSSMLYGKQFDYGDPSIESMIDLPRFFTRISGPLANRQFFPILKLLPFGDVISKRTQRMNVRKTLDNFHSKIIEEHVKNLTESAGDYIDVYLSQRKEDIDLDYLSGTLEILFLTGAETVATTLRWTMLYLSANPAIQSKVQAEIDAVVGSERSPSMNDQLQMPYTQATIMEVNRCVSLAPLGLVRSNEEDVKVLGYRIPKDSYVVANLWAAHHDEKLFEDPKSFKPERFLDSNRALKKCNYLMPFSAGKRSCVGETIARVDLFLFVTSILQQFTIYSDMFDPTTVPYQRGVGRNPADFTIRAVQREGYS